MRHGQHLCPKSTDLDRLLFGFFAFSTFSHRSYTDIVCPNFSPKGTAADRDCAADNGQYPLTSVQGIATTGVPQAIAAPRVPARDAAILVKTRDQSEWVLNATIQNVCVYHYCPDVLARFGGDEIVRPKLAAKSVSQLRWAGTDAR